MAKKICLVINTLEEGGGIERAVLSIAGSLSKLNHKVDVITLNNQKNKLPLSSSNFNIHYIKEPKCHTKFICSIKHARLLKAKMSEIGIKFDLCLANSTYDALVCKWAKLPNLYYIVHNSIGIQHQQDTNIAKLRRHTTLSFKGMCKVLIKKFLYGTFLKSLYKNKNLVTVSQGVKEDLLAFGVKPKSIKTIYNPFDFAYIRKQSEAYPVKEQEYVIHVGNFTPVKRYDILINAYYQSGIKPKLLLIGDHSRESGVLVKQLINDLGLNDRIVLKGFQSNPFPYIKSAQALILSSDQEGFGMVLVEALILGTPVVSTNCVSGPSEILVDELQQFLSPIGDSKALAINLRNAVGNPIKITHKYISRFNDNTVAEQYLSLQASNKSFLRKHI